MSRRAKSVTLEPTEAQEQAAVVAWFDAYARTKNIDPRLLMASAGGAVLGGDARLRAIRAAQLKRQGYRNGTPDLFLSLPKRDLRRPFPVLFCGLYIEMKRATGGKVSREQSSMIDLLREQESPYKAVVCNGAEAAIREIKGYIEL